jgi:predicted nucleic acid-binding protein
LNRDLVVDASVLIKLFVVEELSVETARFFSSSSFRLFVPDFLYVECTNILWKYVWRFGYSPDEARKNLAALHTMALYPAPIVPLQSPAFELSLRHHISAYDATYAALTQWMSLPLITADGKFFLKLKGTDTDVRWLADLVNPTPSLPGDPNSGKAQL